MPDRDEGMILLPKNRQLALEAYPLMKTLRGLAECAWFNPAAPCDCVAAMPEAQRELGVLTEDVDEAAMRLKRFAPYLAAVFPETAASGGILESPLIAAPALQDALQKRYLSRGSSLEPAPGKLWLKMDALLPISGSIKARGGIYEVLAHAESLALGTGRFNPGARHNGRSSDYSVLAESGWRDFFSNYEIAVGSTGNLGLSIGIIASQLGFKTVVHMSADARPWKKERLRKRGVKVIEYPSDYSKAVEAGRRAAADNPFCHFIDDERSRDLFLGYAVAGRRLAGQLKTLDITVDAGHPLFVYLPCGVGGGPGGVAFGLKLEFGDAVHCIFSEPTHSPCMLLGSYTGLYDGISVQDIGLDNVTAADGLAVGRPSGLVGRGMRHLVDGFMTVSDSEMFALVALAEDLEGVRFEPSAVAGLPGMWRVWQDETGYRERLGLDAVAMRNSTHIAWATGGGMVPEEEMSDYISKGRALLRAGD